jgi:hypothetical protein
LFIGNSKADNYSFVDSKDNPLIQVSDCIVGLLGKYYTYINRLSRQEEYEMFNAITTTQRSTLKLFAQVIKNQKISVNYYFIQVKVFMNMKLEHLFSTVL